MDFDLFVMIGAVALAAQAGILIMAIMLIKKGGLLSLVRYKMSGGILDIIGHRHTRGISFGVRNKPQKIHIFKATDELGKESEAPTIIREPMHHLEGTTAPINVIIEDIGESVDLFDRYKPSKSDKYQNQLLKGTLLTGIMIGAAQRDDSKKSFMETWAPVFQIMIICGLIVIGVGEWMILSNMAPLAPAAAAAAAPAVAAVA
jgi:hypothetical protein